jgi:ubiquinone/menaquinone biosynthesis C-methylase UbiE
MSANLDAATRAHFTARATTYTSGGDDSLRAMLALAAPRAGERVLDVATGTGLVLFALAEAVNPGGFAVGVDFTAAMLAQAATRRASTQRDSTVGTTNGAATVGPGLAVADAAKLPLVEGSFDIVTCRFSVHHMSDPAASLAAMASVLRPKGRLVVADFVRPDEPDEAERHDRLEKLRGHQYVQIYERARLEQLMADAGCPVRGAELSERMTNPKDLVMGSNVAPEDREALAKVIEEIAQRGSGGGFEVRGEGKDVRFSRADVVLLGVKLA